MIQRPFFSKMVVLGYLWRVMPRRTNIQKAQSRKSKSIRHNTAVTYVNVTKTCQGCQKTVFSAKFTGISGIKTRKYIGSFFLFAHFYFDKILDISEITFWFQKMTIKMYQMFTQNNVNFRSILLLRLSLHFGLKFA